MNQNIKYDMTVLSRVHFPIASERLGLDPMVGDYLLDAGARTHNLEVLITKYLGLKSIPITDLMSKETIDKISARTAKGGLEITELVGTSAWYAPGASVVEMVEAILLDKKKILPCSVYLQGEYGVRNLCVGVPCKLGARGLEKIIEITLTPEEDAAFKKSAASVKELVDVIKV